MDLQKHKGNFKKNREQNQQTNLKEKVPEMTIFDQMIKKVPAFYGTRMFISSLQDSVIERYFKIYELVHTLKISFFKTNFNILLTYV
jgi:hypothetical protein